MLKNLQLPKSFRNASLFAIGGAMILVFALLGASGGISELICNKTSDRQQRPAPLTDEIREALNILSNADEFHTGRLAKETPKYLSYLKLRSTGLQYWDEFVKMTKTGTPAGRVYGAILLLSADRIKARPILNEMLSDNAEFQKHTICLVYPTTVKEEIASLLEYAKSAQVKYFL